MNPSLEETIYVDFITSAPTTGAATDADSTPTAEVFEDATDTAILSPTVTKRTSKTGNYRVPVACTAANGFEAGKSYNLVVAATVGAVAAKAVIRTFQMRTRDIDDVSTYAGADTPGTTTLLSRVPSALTITGGKVDVNDKTGFSLVAAYDPSKTAMQAGALVALTSAYDAAKLAAPVGAAMTLTAAYDAAKSAASQTSVNTIDDFIDTEVAAIKVVTDKLDTALELDGAVYRYTVNALENAPVGGGGGATDWTAPEREQIRHRLGIDGTAAAPSTGVPSLASQSSVNTVSAKTNNLPSDPADASDIAASFTTVNGKLDARLDVAVSTRSTYAGADTAGTTTLLSRVPTTVSSQTSNDQIYAAIDTEIGAIKSKTDQLTFTGGKVDANATTTITPTDLNAIADALLKRDWNSVTGEAAYSALNAFRMLRNVWNTPAGVLHVKKEDGTTDAWTRTLAVDPTAQPIVGAS